MQSPPTGNVEQRFFLPDLCSPQALFILVLLAELLALLGILVGSGLPGFAWADFALLSLFMLWSTLGSAALLCLLRAWLSRLSLQWASLIAIAMVLLVVSLTTLFTAWLSTGYFAVAWTLLLRNLLVALVLAGIALRYAFVAEQLRQRQQGELAARIEALQSRINPHFLFNTLNSIASLIPEAPGQAERAVEDLAALFRATLQSGQAEVEWRREQDLCERYLRIEQWRLGERLRVNWLVDAVPARQPLPVLSLQPLLENAIVHGIQHLPEGGDITIQARREGDKLFLQVTNPLPALAADTAGNRLALDNIHHRLQALYGDAAGLRLQASAHSFCAELRLPLYREVM